MTDKIPLQARLRISFCAITWFILFCTFLLGALVLTAWSPWLLWLFVAIAFIIALPVSWCIRRYSKLVKTKFSHLIKTATLTLFILVSAFTLPFYFLAYYSEAHPLIMPQAVLTNGKKTVTFQGMVHVGSENFYKSVIYDLEMALDDGYRLYYEGITPSTPEADTWFSKVIAGGGSLSTNYRDIASVCGVEFQLDYFQLMARDMQRNPDRHATIDVTTEALQKEYLRLAKENPEFAKASNKESNGESDASDDTAKRIITFIHDANEGQKTIIGVLCRGFFSIRLQPSLSGNAPQPLDPLLLDFRNQHLAEQILAEKSDKIYITYGAGHLPGVIKLLQQTDPAWELKSLKWLRGMSAPEHLEGQL
jgi:hypothetical protein